MRHVPSGQGRDAGAGACGLIYLSTPKATVGLIVQDGLVVDGPPYARRWTLGRDAREVWREAAQRGATLAWLPDHDGRIQA